MELLRDVNYANFRNTEVMGSSSPDAHLKPSSEKFDHTPQKKSNIFCTIWIC